ncbi:MAG: M23 family metallopeptidase [Clostridia bacterium]|nr:M23 family metallopeptidase [Clostridia bacterium]
MPKFNSPTASPARGAAPKSPQKGSQGEGRSRALQILIYIGIALILLIPTYLAIANYLVVKNRPEQTTDTYYIGITVQGPSGYVIEAKADGQEGTSKESAELFQCFKNMLDNAIYTPGIPDTHTGRYLVTVETNNDSKQYTFHFASTDGAAYYTNADGQTYRTADNAAEYFLNSPYSHELYTQATPPILTTAATDRIIPTELNWSYKTQAGTYAVLQQITTTQELLTYPIANDVAFYFSLEPTTCHLTIRDGDTVLHESDRLDNIALPQLTQGKLLDFEIEAIYRQDSRYNYYGRALYRFRMSVVEAASFTLDTNENSYGSYFMLSCQNVRNEQNLQITAEPALLSSPVIFRRGETVYAAIPADTVGTRRLTVTYGTVSSSFTLGITQLSGTVAHAYETADLTNQWQALLEQGLAGRIAAMGATAASNLLPPSTAFGLPVSNTDSRLFAFGDTLTVKGTTLQSSPLPLEYYRTTDDIRAMSKGKILKVGQGDEILGTYVIVDHGCGLYTWYCGLSEVLKSEGTIVAAGDIIGRAGKTGAGFADESGVMILATWGRTAISPQYLREHTFHIA